MPVSEIERIELVNRLVVAIGEEAAETLMKCLLTEGRDQFATKDDLKVLEVTLRGEFAEFRAELAELRAETRAEFAEIRAETRAEFAEIRGYIDSALGKQTRLNVAMFATFMVTNWGIMIPFLVA